jgi:BirA family biotin operon repressor/biotin-[acetyl-CoA-carboxylase] ligase
MDWVRSRGVAARFAFLEQAGSTNDELRQAATGVDATAWPHGSVLVTDDQTAGRGRLGRAWLAPTGKTLAISVLIRPDEVEGALPIDAYGWLPLAAGAAMTETVRDAVREAAREPDGEADGSGGLDVDLKWPNDVLISGFKVCGILSEMVAGTRAVVIGAGLNLTLDEHDLPTLTSTSMLLATGSRPDADAVLAHYLERLLDLVGRLASAGGDAVASGLADRVAALCGTLGQEVRVELPGGGELLGTAERIDRDGRLVVRDREHGEPVAVAAGDVTHLRY